MKLSNLFKSLMVLCLLPVLVLTASTTQATRPTCGQWSIVTSPSPGSSGNFLSSVAVVSARDVWVVGSYNNNAPSQTLIEHWNGTSWSIVNSPSPGSYGNYLFSVAAVSASNVWAVGYFYNGSGGNQTLIEHWNGTQWSVVRSPGSSNDILYGVAAVSASDTWAVGFSNQNYPNSTTLIEHWNGTQWSVVTSPNPGPYYNELNGVAMASANEIWAVGDYKNNNAPSQTLIEHWNGMHWSAVTSPNPSANDSLGGVAAVSANNVWAVGTVGIYSSVTLTLIEHWNGTQWSAVKSPSTGSSDNYLGGVAAVSKNDVWAVGGDGNSGSGATARTLIEHWNGTRWSIVTSPNLGIGDGLSEVAAISANDVWAVGGSQNSNGSYQTMIEHYC